MGEATGRRVFITGGGGGIGAVTGRLLAQRGWRVALLDRDGALAAKTAAAIGKDAGTDRARGYAGDVTDIAAVEAALDDMAQAWGGVVKQEADRYGMKFVSQDPNWSTDAMAQALTNIIAQKPDVIVTQKAMEAVEAVFSARDARKLTWTQINNTTVTGGIFLVGPQQLKVAGNDGLVNTSDDGAIETITLPGKDQTLDTSDDQTVALSSFTREIKIADVANESGQLRSIRVTVTYRNGASIRSYTLTSFISAYS